jgi:hypothetical protein
MRGTQNIAVCQSQVTFQNIIVENYNHIHYLPWLPLFNPIQTRRQGSHAALLAKWNCIFWRNKSFCVSCELANKHAKVCDISQCSHISKQLDSCDVLWC